MIAEHLLTYIAKQKKNNTLFHALCIYGENYTYVKDTAEDVAALILNTEKERLHTSPDIDILKRIEDKKTGKLKKNISREQVTDFLRLVCATSQTGGNTVGIIEQPEFLSSSAANAMLKKIEEPTKNTFFLFATTRNDQMLPTIISRVHQLYIHSTEQSVENSDDESIHLKQFIGIPFHKKIELLQPFFADKKNHIQSRAKLEELLQSWMKEIHEHIHSDLSGEKKAVFPELVDTIEYTKTQLHDNIHPRLLMEKLLAQLPKHL